MSSMLLPAAGGSVATLLLQALVRAVRRDGYGTGPPAPAQRHWAAGTTVEPPSPGPRA